jgi:hypothetical protein
MNAYANIGFTAALMALSAGAVKPMFAYAFMSCS